jgi:hypothetical protein
MNDKKGSSIGNLFVNDYKVQGSKMPDFTGFLEITRDQIQDLIADGKAGKDVKIKLAAWEYPSKKDPNQIRYFIVAETGEKQESKPKNEWADDPVPF